MSKHIHKYSHTARKTCRGAHRFEHWYVDNQVYFITARLKGGRERPRWGAGPPPQQSLSRANGNGRVRVAMASDSRLYSTR